MDHCEVIEDALIYIENNIEQALTLESVSRNLNMSKYYFHRLFSAMMGCSLHQYILSRRLNASLKFIQEGQLSLTEIAYHLNFGTQSSFIRAFKRHYGIVPSFLKKEGTIISPKHIPPVIKRPLKNINGDVVTDFTLMEFEAIRVTGIAFEVDLSSKDFKTTIRSHSKMLLDHIDDTMNGSCYVIYSNCQPDSTRFKCLIGVPHDIQINKHYYFTIDLPQIFCARFKYSGDLLEIGDVFITDFTRFLNISMEERDQSDIELIQVFDNIHVLDEDFHIYVPIKKLPIDSDF
jgi:AraC family transcriptional regulator